MDEETMLLLQRTIELLLEKEDVPFLTHDGKETTTHDYAAFLRSIVGASDPPPGEPPTA
jgi:hypothetical protein